MQKHQLTRRRTREQTSLIERVAGFRILAFFRSGNYRGNKVEREARTIVMQAKVRRFDNIDFNTLMAQKNAEIVAKGAKAAQYAEYYDGVQLSEGQGVDRSYEVMVASMSKLQRRQIDKDGDGKLSSKELAAHGFGNEMDFSV